MQYIKTKNLTQKKQVLCGLRGIFLLFSCQTPDNEAALSTWLPLEYDLQMTYGEKDVQFSGYLKELKRQINEDSEKKAGRTLI